MKLIIEVLALLVISAIVIFIAIVVLGRNPVKLAQGELRCQGGGAIIINIEGKDYAVNGMASVVMPAMAEIRMVRLNMCVWSPLAQALNARKGDRFRVVLLGASAPGKPRAAAHGRA